MITKLLYILTVIGFLLAGYALINVFKPVEPTDLTPIGHMIGFVGFVVFGITMFEMAGSFKNIEFQKEALP